MIAAVLLAGALDLVTPADERVRVSATFVAATGKAPAAVAVSFDSRDADIHVDREPAPRLELESQDVLRTARVAPVRRVAGPGRYLQPDEPVVFKVALAPGTARGSRPVRASVTYFYCSEREGWCRKGIADVDVLVTVR
jgi:hypothetical protein